MICILNLFIFNEGASSAERLPRAVREPLSGGASPPSGRAASFETGGLSPAHVPATAKKGTAMHDNKISQSNVLMQRAAVEPTGVVTR